jgi:hypothetical protein
MKIESLGYIRKLLKDNGINYEFGEWTSEVVYPYFVGEYQESEALNESGMLETNFILNGFTRGNWLELEQAKQTIRELADYQCLLENGVGFAIKYGNSLIIPTGDIELKRIQINLRIKEWSVK